MRGGGLLKYCCLLARRYRLSRDVDATTLERYMCSRFFIDFPDAERQRCQLENYLANHFAGPTWRLLRIPWLSMLRTVVSRGALCLGHRRKETLSLIDRLVELERRPPAPVAVWAFGGALPGIPTDAGSCASSLSPSGSESTSDLDDMFSESNFGEISSVPSSESGATDAEDVDKLSDVLDDSPGTSHLSYTGYAGYPIMPSVPPQLGAYYVPYFPGYHPVYFGVPPPPLPGYVHHRS